MDFGKFKFIREFDSQGDDKVEFTVSGQATLDDMCEAFERFLKATGYCIDGYTVELVETDEDNHTHCEHDHDHFEHDQSQPAKRRLNDATPEEWDEAFRNIMKPQDVSNSYTFPYPNYAVWNVKKDEKKT